MGQVSEVPANRAIKWLRKVILAHVATVVLSVPNNIPVIGICTLNPSFEGIGIRARKLENTSYHPFIFIGTHNENCQDGSGSSAIAEARINERFDVGCERHMFGC